MGEVANWAWVCPGCGENRAPGAEYVLGPHPLTPSYGPLPWDVDCLRSWRAKTEGRPTPEQAWAATEYNPGWRVKGR